MTKNLKIISIYIVTVTISIFLQSTLASSEPPSFDCSKVEPGSIEEIICNDESLSRLDRELAEVYKEAEKEAVDEKPPTLKAEQRGWIKSRDECWKAENVKDCIRTTYQLRIAELQATYRLTYNSGPLYFTCDGNPKNEIVLTIFDTEPSTLIAEYGDERSLMYKDPTARGSKYQGRNETTWIEGNKKIRVKWGFDTHTMNCKEKSSPE